MSGRRLSASLTGATFVPARRIAWTLYGAVERVSVALLMPLGPGRPFDMVFVLLCSGVLRVRCGPRSFASGRRFVGFSRAGRSPRISCSSRFRHVCIP